MLTNLVCDTYSVEILNRSDFSALPVSRITVTHLQICFPAQKKIFYNHSNKLVQINFSLLHNYSCSARIKLYYLRFIIV